MNFSSLLNQLSGSASELNSVRASSEPAGSMLNGLASKIPGGLAGGAVAGGLVALLAGNKSIRKTATKAATYGGAAVLGGLAFKAYQNWKQNSAQSGQQVPKGATSYASASTSTQAVSSNFETEALEHMNGAQTPERFQIAILKAMIASARADGSIDKEEQTRISDAIERMEFDNATKSLLFELFLKPISIEEIVRDLDSDEQKAEIYLASCLVVNLDHQDEFVHLGNLSKALQLPEGLEHHLRTQARDALQQNL